MKTEAMIEILTEELRRAQEAVRAVQMALKGNCYPWSAGELMAKRAAARVTRAKEALAELDAITDCRLAAAVGGEQEKERKKGERGKMVMGEGVV